MLSGVISTLNSIPFFIFLGTLDILAAICSASVGIVSVDGRQIEILSIFGIWIKIPFQALPPTNRFTERPLL